MPDGGNEIWKKGQEVWSGKKKNFFRGEFENRK